MNPLGRNKIYPTFSKHKQWLLLGLCNLFFMACTTKNQSGLAVASSVYLMSSTSSSKVTPKAQLEGDLNAFVCAPKIWACLASGASYATGKIGYKVADVGSTTLTRNMLGGNASITLTPFFKKYAKSKFSLFPMVRATGKVLGVKSTSSGILEGYLARTSSQIGVAYLGNADAGLRIKTYRAIWEATVGYRYQSELLSKSSLNSSGITAQLTLLIPLNVNPKNSK